MKKLILKTKNYEKIKNKEFIGNFKDYFTLVENIIFPINYNGPPWTSFDKYFGKNRFILNDIEVFINTYGLSLGPVNRYEDNFSHILVFPLDDNTKLLKFYTKLLKNYLNRYEHSFYKDPRSTIFIINDFNDWDEVKKIFKKNLYNMPFIQFMTHEEI